MNEKKHKIVRYFRADGRNYTIELFNDLTLSKACELLQELRCSLLNQGSRINPKTLDDALNAYKIICNDDEEI